MLGYLLRRILAAIPVMGVVALFVFLLLRLTPGDPAAILAGEVFVGDAEGHLNGAGTLALHSHANRDITCVGEFTSSATKSGAVPRISG